MDTRFWGCSGLVFEAVSLDETFKYESMKGVGAIASDLHLLYLHYHHIICRTLENLREIGVGLPDINVTRKGPETSAFG